MRALLRRWLLGVEDNNPIADAASGRSTDGPFGDMARLKNQFQEGGTTKYFMISEADNGYIVTMRVYGSDQKVYANRFGEGPNFKDRVFIIPSNGETSVGDAIVQLLAKHKFLESN